MPSRKLWIVVALCICLCIVVLAGLLTGSYDLSISDVFMVLTGKEVENGFIILRLRLPRVLLAICAGGILALSGFYMQALIKNPLADPYIMGLTSGAGFGVNLVLLGFIPIASYSIYSLPLVASLGAILSLLIVLVLGFRSFFEDNAKLLIAGIAVAAIFNALTGLMIYKFADSDQVRKIVFWTFGSLDGASWEAVYIAMFMVLVAVVFGWIFSRRMDVLVLGDMQARSLGMKVTRIKVILLLVSSIVVGGVVAFTGPIGFVGMMIPHFSRALFGSNHRPNIILGVLMGGMYLCACDIISRWILPPAGLPVGIVTAILGVPFFLFILFKKESYL